MNRHGIVTAPNAALRQRSRRVGIITEEVKHVVDRMQIATLDWEKNRGNEVGVALAAPQIGVLERIIIIRSRLDDKRFREFEVFINPEITKLEGGIIYEPEGCLSIPDLYGRIPRYETVRLSALDINGRSIRIKVSGFLARVFQHEVDHLHGRLFVDKVKNDEFYRITEYGRLEPLTRDQVDTARLLRNR